MNCSLSLIISAYNEAPIIEDCINTCITALSSQFDDYELILLDDASTDNTGPIIDKLASDNPNINIKIIHNQTNLNMGASIQKGMKEATKDYITFNAADLPFNPQNYKEIINQKPNADMIVVQRKKYNGTTPWRRFTSTLNRALLKILFPKLKKGIKDTNYFQITKKEALPKITPLTKDPIFTWPEMIFRARLSGLTVETTTTDYNPKRPRKGSFGKPKDIFGSLKETLRFRLRLRMN